MGELFHISEDSEITRFEPRESPTPFPGVTEKVVWAVDQEHLPNYLLPRDCPRVTFYPIVSSRTEDIERFIGPGASHHVVAIEGTWFNRVLNQKIWIYEMPDESFEEIDAGAGYHISRNAVTPLSRRKITIPIEELLKRNVELRIVPCLWPLCDAVTISSLQFSCIRMRNASPRKTTTFVKETI